MQSTMLISIYGEPASREMAKLTLENQPEVRRIDASPDFGELRLLTSKPLDEGQLLLLLQSSGISGFRLIRC